VTLVGTPPRRADGGIAAAQAALDGLAATFGDRVILHEYGWFPRPLPLAANPGAIAFESFHDRLRLAKKSAYPVLLNGQFVFSLKTDQSSAQEVYDGLFAEVAPALGTAAKVKLSARAERRGDKVEVHAQVSGLPKPGYVSVLLVENWSYYAWPGLVFSQHRAVRATQGDAVGVNGKPRFEFRACE